MYENERHLRKTADIIEDMREMWADLRNRMQDVEAKVKNLLPVDTRKKTGMLRRSNCADLGDPSSIQSKDVLIHETPELSSDGVEVFFVNEREGVPLERSDN